MGVMEKFRASTKYILWVLIISFGILWALADTQVFDAMMAGPRSLGEVNGKAISFEAYNQKVQSYSERYRYETGDAATSEMRAYYEDLAWDELVLDVIIKEKMDELGIKVTDDEVVEMITGPNPDPFIAQQFTRENGSIDRDALNAAISAPENTQIWIMIEQQLRDKRRREKLAQFLQASVKVSDAEVANEYVARNSSVTFEYVRLPYSDISDSLITVEESELRSFYNKEIERYQRKKTWRFNYVEFDLTPTAEDTARTYREIQLVRDELAGDTNDSLVFLQYSSESPYSVTKVAKSEVKDIYKPVLQVGLNQTTDVIAESNGLLHVLKKVAETKTEVSFIDYATRVIADPLGTVDERAKEADDFSYFATEGSFTEEAERRGFTVKSGIATEDTPFIAGLGQSRQTINWLKGAKVGEVTQSPIELPKAFVVLQLTEIQPEGARPFEEVRPQVERLYKTEKRKTLAAAKLSEAANGKSTLVDIANSAGKEVKMAENVRFNADVIPGVGREPYVLGKTTQLGKDAVSSVIEGEFAAFIVRVTEKTQATTEALAEATKMQIKGELEQKRNAAISQTWIEELKEAAEIKDYRSLVLRSR
jgi:peptidyl-prolyl cis-trans isomerase D